VIVTACPASSSTPARTPGRSGNALLAVLVAHEVLVPTIVRPDGRMSGPASASPLRRPQRRRQDGRVDARRRAPQLLRGDAVVRAHAEEVQGEDRAEPDLLILERLDEAAPPRPVGAHDERALPRERRARKAQETKKALIDAFLRLICRESVAGVSVRDVAREAGVNHGLVHRYFGSKENLVRDAVAEISARVHEGDRAALSERSFQFLRDNPALPLVVARACLDGPHDVLALAAPTPERMETIVAPIRAWLERLGLAIDPRVVNALGTAALLGWFVLRPLLDASYDLPDDADAQVAAIARAIDRLFASA